MRTLVGLFVSGLLGMSALMYLGRPGGGELYVSLATGIVCGLSLATVGRRVMRDGVDAVLTALRPLTIFNVLTAGGGLALLLWGTVVRDWGLALSGLPFLTLGGGLILARSRISRHSRT